MPERPAEHDAASACASPNEHTPTSACPSSPEPSSQPAGARTAVPAPPHPAFDAFVDTVARLRAPQGGCPWNRAQTHASIGDYMIEEAYEALDAIQAGDAAHLREELGDVLLQVVLHAQIAADAGEFTIDDVCADIDAKMIRRHPHVFADVRADNANEVAELWEQVKLAEKAKLDAGTALGTGGPNGAGGPSGSLGNPGVVGPPASLLASVPTHFPALLQAQKISRKAVAAGFEWETLGDVWAKVSEEKAELEAAYAAAPKTADGKVLAPAPTDPFATVPEPTPAPAQAPSPTASAPSHAGALEASATSPASPTDDGAAQLVAAVEMEFGDLLFSLVNVARKMGIDAEKALRSSNAKFRARFAQVERAAFEQGRAVEELTLSEMEGFWQKAKEEE